MALTNEQMKLTIARLNANAPAGQTWVQGVGYQPISSAPKSNTTSTPTKTTTSSSLSMGSVPSGGVNNITAPSAKTSTVSNNYSSGAPVVSGSTAQKQTGEIGLSTPKIVGQPTYAGAQTITPELLQQLLSGINKPQPIADNTNQINAVYEEKKKADLALLRQTIANNRAKYEKQMSGAKEQFQPSRNNVDANRARDLQRIREIQSAQGIFGGDNITAQMDVNTQAGGDLSELDRQEQQLKTDAQATINQLESSGDLEGVRLVSENAAQRLQSILNEKNRVEDGNYNRNQDYIKNVSDTFTKAQNQANADRTFNYNAKQGELENYIKSITGLGDSFDYQGEINKLTNDGDTSNDYKIPYLQQAREDKKATQNAAAAAAEKAALEQWKIQQGVAQDWAKTNYDINKPYSTSGIGSGSSGGKLDNTYITNTYNALEKYIADNGWTISSVNDKARIAKVIDSLQYAPYGKAEDLETAGRLAIRYGISTADIDNAKRLK